MKPISALLALAGTILFIASFLPGEALSEAAPGQPPSPLTPVTSKDPAQEGAVLFQAKGCAACHRHVGIGIADAGIGPDLTNYEGEPAFLRQWLEDPLSLRATTQMPDLDLTPAEVETFVAFLGSNSDSEPGDSLSSCPVTVPPNRPFSPAAPYPATAPYAGKFWFGTESLWTMLPEDGRWDQLLQGEKVWWWREGYDGGKEPQPALGITARRLDGEASLVESQLPATNGYHQDFHWAMLLGFQVTAPGCWEITGHYGDDSLSFVVWVAEDSMINEW